jgi:hypothetical protein
MPARERMPWSNDDVLALTDLLGDGWTLTPVAAQALTLCSASAGKEVRYQGSARENGRRSTPTRPGCARVPYLNRALASCYAQHADEGPCRARALFQLTESD